MINWNYLIDMDGVLVHGNSPIPGAVEFVNRLISAGKKFLILTNNPIYHTSDLAHRLSTMGFEIPENRIFTSAVATALFLKNQKPDGKAFAIGESGLTTALHSVGYILTDIEPDYVVLGETNTYNYEMIRKALHLILSGARFIATNPDPNGPGQDGIVPGAGAMAALIEKATGVSPFFVGKPNPVMIRTALNFLDVHSEETIMVGDRMETDIVAGVMSGLHTILVLSGVTQISDIQKYPYRPTWIKKSVAEIEV